MIRRAHWVAVIALVALMFITYFPALRNGFIWDDGDHFTRNPAMTRPAYLFPKFLDAHLLLLDALLATGQSEVAESVIRQALQIATQQNRNDIVEQLKSRLRSATD